jgi:hypothetical protein
MAELQPGAAVRGIEANLRCVCVMGLRNDGPRRLQRLC